MTKQEFETLTFGQRVYSNCLTDKDTEYQVIDTNPADNTILIRTGIAKEESRHYALLDAYQKRSLVEWLQDLPNKEK